MGASPLSGVVYTFHSECVYLASGYRFPFQDDAAFRMTPHWRAERLSLSVPPGLSLGPDSGPGWEQGPGLRYTSAPTELPVWVQTLGLPGPAVSCFGEYVC